MSHWKNNTEKQRWNS